MLSAREIKMIRAEQYAGDGCQQGNRRLLAVEVQKGKKPISTLTSS